jgi:phage-related minor tail protein
MKTRTLLATGAAIAAIVGLVMTTIAGNGIIMQQAEASSCQTHGDFSDPSTHITKCSSPNSQGDQFNHNYHLSDPT